MRVSPIILLAAVGASAHPSGHKHLHRAHHDNEKRGDTIVATIDNKVVSWTVGGSPWVVNQKPTPIASTSSSSTAAAVVASATVDASLDISFGLSLGDDSSSSSSATATATETATATDSGSGGTGLATYSAFPTCSSSSKKRATYAQINYEGNTGCDGYGSNIAFAQDSAAESYDYKVKVVNSFSEDAACVVWNKIGNTGENNGFFEGMGGQTFTVSAGSHQYVVFDTNSQGGMCCASGSSVPTTTYGEYNCPWLEFDFADAANDGWSGFDASALVEASVSGPYGVLEVCTTDDSVCSSLDGSGGGSNAYLAGDEAADGIGGNLEPGSVSLTATWS